MAAQFVVGLAHLEGYCVEKNDLSAYYWLRLAEASSCELGHWTALWPSSFGVLWGHMKLRMWNIAFLSR